MNDVTKHRISPEAAVARAFWAVKVPSLVLLAGPLLAYAKFGAKEHAYGLTGLAWFLPILAGAFVLGWLSWSLLVPRWRLWAYERVSDIEELKRQAADHQIIWPEGHFFERTEIASKELREKIRALERKAANAG